MARNNTPTNESTDYLAILGADGATVAFVNPARHVPMDKLCEALVAKGVKAEIKTPQEDVTEVKL